MVTSFRLSLRVWTSIGFLVLGYALSLVATTKVAWQIQDELPAVSAFAVQATELSQTIPRRFEEQTRQYGRALITGENDLAEKARTGLRTTESSLRRLAGLPGADAELKIEIDRTLELFKKYIQGSEAVFETSRRRETSAETVRQINALSARKRELQAAFQAIAGQVRASIQGNVAGLSRRVRRQNQFNVFLSVGIILVALAIIYWVIRRSIIGALFRITEKLYDSSQKVAAISADISAGSQQLAEGATEQAAAITEASASLEQLVAMTRRNAEDTREARKLGAEALRAVENLSDSMGQTAAAMGGIRDRGQEIGRINQTIQELSFQTNLLALNAAVEAARAGQAGAGFAVVAGEVRSLAARSAEASRDTETLIETTVAEIEAGAACLDETRTALEGAMRRNSEVGLLVDRIAKAGEEQVKGIDEINRTMEEIDKIVQTNASNAEIFASVFIKLNGQAERLSYFIRKLKGLTERRRHIRVKIALRGTFCPDGVRDAVDFVTRDISANGASVLTAAPLPDRAIGDMAIRAGKTRFPSIRARVLRDEGRTENDRHLSALTFVDLGPEREAR
ncbi:MAG: methyl-accepting chemotaxis protein, partial [Desulfococcaceae bacterium]